MPPRKRAASAPKSEPEQEPLTPGNEDEATGQQADADEPADPADETADPTPAGGDQEPDADEDEDEDDKGDEPARSDLQSADKPCGECFPNGWPDLKGALSVGCTHGTYIRKQS